MVARRNSLARPCSGVKAYVILRPFPCFSVLCWSQRSLAAFQVQDENASPHHFPIGNSVFRKSPASLFKECSRLVFYPWLWWLSGSCSSGNAYPLQSRLLKNALLSDKIGSWSGTCLFRKSRLLDFNRFPWPQPQLSRGWSFRAILSSAGKRAH